MADLDSLESSVDDLESDFVELEQRVIDIERRQKELEDRLAFVANRMTNWAAMREIDARIVTERKSKDAATPAIRGDRADHEGEVR